MAKQHTIGSHIHDLVSDGGGVLDGLSMRCGSCNSVCLIAAPRGRFTTQRHLDTLGCYWCPYCGADRTAKLKYNYVTDTRPSYDA